MKFHTQLKAKDIFKFSLAYTYSGVQALLTIFMLAVGGYMIFRGASQPGGQVNIVFGVIVIALFVVVNPLMLYLKAKKQAIENPVYKNPTYYTLQDDGIFVELGEESATIEWIRVFKITHFMGLTLLYTGRQQAFVFPDYEMGNDRAKMLDYMKEHIKEARKKAVEEQAAKEQAAESDISKYSKASVEDEQTEADVEVQAEISEEAIKTESLNEVQTETVNEVQEETVNEVQEDSEEQKGEE